MCCAIFVALALGVSMAPPLVLAAENGNDKEQAIKFNSYAYIFLGPNLDPKKDRTEIITPAFSFTAIGIDFQHKEQVIEVAKEIVSNGAQLIELCGGFGPIWVTKVSEAIQNRVPVGSVMYGPEARKPLIDLLSPVSNQKGK